MIKKHERFFYGMLDDVEYSEILIEFTEKLKKKTYTPQYEKIGEVVRLIQDRDFQHSKQFKDKVLINTIMITQLARYYWMMGNFDVCSRAYETQYQNMLDICKSVYHKQWYNGEIEEDDDLESYFRLFTKSKLLEEFHFPKDDFWYTGGYDAWQFGYAKDVKCMKKNGYADSELWSLDYKVMQWTAIRMEAFIKNYESGKFYIQIDKKDLTRYKKTLKFVKVYAEIGDSMFYSPKLGFLSKDGRPDQEKIDKAWADFGNSLAEMWW